MVSHSFDRFRLLAKQRGQAAVLIALCMFSMVVFLALATNMGILVNDRVRMQNAADLTAYSGAFEQARIMNRMTQINYRIFHMAALTRKNMTCPGMPDLDEITNGEDGVECNPSTRWDHRVFIAMDCQKPPKPTTAYLNIQQVRMNALAALFDTFNLRKGTATRAGVFTALGNFRGLGRPRHHSFYDKDANSPTFQTVPPVPLVLVDRRRTTFHYAMWYRRGMCDDMCPAFKWLGDIRIPVNIGGCIQIWDKTLDTWYVKRHPGPTVFFPARVNGVPAKDFLDIRTPRGGYFGADAAPGVRGSDELWSFAVAKPFGGNLGTGESQGKLNHVTFKFFIAEKTGWVFDYNSFHDYDSDFEGRFIPEYRARMAGLQENMANYTGAKLKPIQLMLDDFNKASGAGASTVLNYVTH